MAGKRTSPLVKELSREMKRHADQKYRKTLQTFFKEPIKVHGVRTPEFRRISRDFWQRVKHLPKAEVFRLCEELLAVRNGEERGVAFDWAYRLRNQYQPADFNRFEQWLRKYVSNWGACDTFSTSVLGEMLVRFPQFLPRVRKWAKSPNRWLRRAAAVVMIVPNRRRPVLRPHRQGRYVKEAFEIADTLLEDDDDMVQKGYGWMLKEIANREQQRVFEFVMARQDRMPRTALRYAIEKMPAAMKKQAMARERDCPRHCGAE